MTRKMMKELLLEGIQRRIESLNKKNQSSNGLSRGHWVRDLVTIKAYLENSDDTENEINIWQVYL